MLCGILTLLISAGTGVGAAAAATAGWAWMAEAGKATMSAALASRNGKRKVGRMMMVSPKDGRRGAHPKAAALIRNRNPETRARLFDQWREAMICSMRPIKPRQVEASLPGES